MTLNELYFYSATIVDWRNLLISDRFKKIITASLKYLVDCKLIKIYAFVVMPNHIHIIWELLSKNGKEFPHASFMKYTSHKFLSELKKTSPQSLKKYEVEKASRKHQFWQRDPLPIHIYSPRVIYQKLDYIHNNPVQGKWMLAKDPTGYKYSSAKFYETGLDDFRMLTHIGERI